VRAGKRAKRMECVVRDQAFPYEVPERGDAVVRVAAAGRVVQRTKKRRAVRLKMFQDGSLARVVVRE
jgi:hypothetical protein